MTLHESVTARTEARPADVFALLTDIALLPEWNAAIVEVNESPGMLAAGAEWKVRLHALGQSWISRSTVTSLDPVDLRFGYRSQTDDGNPSFAEWDWRVQARADGAQVTVVVTLHPVTFWRRYLLVHVRRPALRREMQASVAALTTIANVQHKSRARNAEQTR